MSTRILDLQRRMRELGRLRAGQKVQTKSGKMAPARLETWRLTSQSREHLDAAAIVYGGQVAPWNPGNGLPAQFELVTEADRLRIIVPPGVTFSQAWELWSGGGCQRRCDGQRELLSDQPCMCPANYDARRDAAQNGRACKPTTRLNVMLPEIPDIGVWRLESHGFYAAVELAGAYDLIEMATRQGRMIPAFLRLERRVVKRPGKPRQDFVVPVIEIAHTTGQVLQTLGVIDEMAAPSFGAPQLAAGEQRALPAPVAPPVKNGNGNGAPRETVVRPPARQAVPPAPPLPHEIVAASPRPTSQVDGDAASDPSSGDDVNTPVARDDLGEASPPQQPTSPEDDEGPSGGFKNVGHAASWAGLDNDGRHQLCEWVSRGRTSSSKELTPDEQSIAVRACVEIKNRRARVTDDVDGARLVNLFGFPTDLDKQVDALHGVERGAPDVKSAPSLDETRAELKARITALGDYGRTAWKQAKLPALSRLTVDRVQEALDVVTRAEEQSAPL